jgi:hypothetical protein
MQKPPFASAANEVAVLLNEAAARGHLVILHATPPPQADVKTPALLAFSQLLGMSPAEGRGLLELMKNGQVSREAMHAAMTHNGTPTTGRKIVDVVISRMRKKLRPLNVEIATVYGLGFRLGDGAREKIRRLLAKHDPKLVLDERPKPEGLHTE